MADADSAMAMARAFCIGNGWERKEGKRTGKRGETGRKAVSVLLHEIPL
jgi:hypothetical protein